MLPKKHVSILKANCTPLIRLWAFLNFYALMHYSKKKAIHDNFSHFDERAPIYDACFTFHEIPC